MEAAPFSAHSGCAHLGAALRVGTSSLAAGLATWILGDAGARTNAQQPRLVIGALLILFIGEAPGQDGIISSLVVASVAEGEGKGL